MTTTLGISPKLAAAIGAPLTAVATAMILTGDVDRTSLAALAAIVIGAVLGYHAPAGNVVDVAADDEPEGFTDDDLDGREGVPIEEHVDLAGAA